MSRRTRRRAKRQVKKQTTRFVEARDIAEGDTVSHQGEERTVTDTRHYELNDVPYVELAFEPLKDSATGRVLRSRFRVPVIEREDE